MKVRTIASISIMIPLVTVLTMLIRIPIPATQGYFNFGDAAVILVSLLFGPYVGLIAGGVGSSLADIISGFPNYALVTLLAKGMEGYVAGVIFRRLQKKSRFIFYLCGPIGGLFMISSYFIYESYFFSFGNALVELPLNILQVVLGSIISYTLYALVYPLLAKASM